MKSFKITQSITDRQDASLGLYFKDVSKQSMLNAEEEAQVTQRIREGDKSAINRLVTANLRFVISVAKQYQNKGLSLVDLIQEGNLGLIEGAKRYDPSKGVKFISYAVWWIRQSIMHALSDKCRTVRIPMNQIVNINKITKATEKLEQELGRSPSIEELSNETSISTSNLNLTMSSSNKALSLDTPFKDEDTNCLLDIIPNDSFADDNIIQESISNEVEEVLLKLSNRESDVIRMSFGIGVETMQNEEIANRFGIGSERVRQIQHEAIERIRLKYSDDLKKIL